MLGTVFRGGFCYATKAERLGACGMLHHSACRAVVRVVLQAQVSQSTVLGTVTDSTGAVVPNAEVIVKNEGTNVERKMTTNEAGDFRIAGLEAGFYELTIRSTGFKTFTHKRIDLNSSQVSASTLL